MHSQLFESALGISDPWFVHGVDFDATAKQLTVNIDFVVGSRFPHPEIAGGHPVHATVVKRCRHLSFFRHKLKGFMLLFEAMVLMLAQQMSFTAVVRTVGESWHRVNVICKRYVELALAEIDLSNMTSIAVTKRPTSADTTT